MVNVKDEAAKALENAVNYAEAGEFDKALSLHEWFHHNALDINKGYYGVRLSFNLSNWAAIGKEYPPALSALLELREASKKELLASTDKAELFHDISSINNYLDAQDHTISLFREIDEQDNKLAIQCFKFASDALLDAGEAKLYLKYVLDVKSHVAREIVNYNRAMNHIIDHAPKHDDSIPHFNEHLVDFAVKVSAIVEKNGDLELANEIRDEVWGIINDDRLK